MVTTLFEGILKDLEEFFKCPLQADHNHACLIEMGIGLSIQLEMNSQDCLIVACPLGTLPLNRYRDQLLQAALKANELALPSSGTFAFNTRENQFIFFLILSPSQINRDKIFSVFPPFIEKAKVWKEALETEKIPLLNTHSSSSSNGLFGFMRS